MKYTVAEFRKNMREILDSVDRGAEVIVQRYDKEYIIGAIVTVKPEDVVLPFDSKGKLPKAAGISGEQYSSYEKKSIGKPTKDVGVIPMTADSDVIPMAVEPIEGMRLPPMQQPKRRALKPPAGVAPVDSCPHGFAKGFCKKADCNRKYAA